MFRKLITILRPKKNQSQEVINEQDSESLGCTESLEMGSFSRVVGTPAEKILIMLEERTKDLEPTVSMKMLKIMLIVVALTYVLIHLMLLVIPPFVSLFKYEWLPDVVTKFMSQPIIGLAPLFFAILYYLIIMYKDYHRSHRILNTEMKDIKNIFKQLNLQIKEMKELDDISAAMKTALANVEDTHLFRLLTPDNESISKKLDQFSSETLKCLKEFAKFYQLPEESKKTISTIIDTNIRQKDWGDLYLNFAFKLQLDPWVDAVRTSQFVFVRNLEEFGEKANRNTIITYRDRLKEDLKVIIGLVNGMLYSMIYDDLDVWGKEDYLNKNKAFYYEKKEADLKRLFIYEQEWLENTDKLSCLIYGAKWHVATGYPCRFIERSKLTDQSYFSDTRFVTSCLVNSTVIEMYEECEADLPRRYIYRCNSNKPITDDYKSLFADLWQSTNKKSMTPGKFLEYLNGKTEDKYSDVTSSDEFVSLFGQA